MPAAENLLYFMCMKLEPGCWGEAFNTGRRMGVLQVWDSIPAPSPCGKPDWAQRRGTATACFSTASSAQGTAGC